MWKLSLCAVAFATQTAAAPAFIEDRRADAVFESRLLTECAKPPPQTGENHCLAMQVHEPPCIEYKAFAETFMRSKDIPYTIAKQAWERDEHPAYSLEFVAAISRLIDAAYKSSVVSSNPMEFARVAYDRCMAGNPF